VFNEWLEQHDLLDVLKGTGGCPFPCFTDRASWEKIDPRLKRELVLMADEARTDPYPILTASQFLAFVRDGSRKAYETPYFARRRKLISLALGCCVSGSLADLDEVVNGIWLICEETSWVISAHNGSSHEGMRPAAERPLPDIANPYIDLFAAQTAMILSIICHLLGTELDRVTPLIRRRVSYELDRRIITPFMTRDDYWWMGFIRKDLCNWTPWIVSNVMFTAVCNMADRMRLAELLARGCRMLNRWLTVVPDDGGCDEGAGYWNMAGASLLDCLELLEQVTGGAMTFWTDAKVRNIMLFPVRARLENGWFINFADCDAKPVVNGERLQYAGERLHEPGLIRAGLELTASAHDQISDVPHMWRVMQLLFHERCAMPQTVKTPRDLWLPDLQVRVLERDGLILVAKGGHNGESHNHNDVGSFMLYVDGEPAILDAGNMVYTAKTFSDRRYELWNVRSVNHNLPVIHGCEQLPGVQYRAVDVHSAPDGLSLHIEGAYGQQVAGLTCSRSLRLGQGELILEDRISTAAEGPVTWVFMLRAEPKQTADTIISGAVSLTIPQGMEAAWHEIPVEDARMARSFPGSLWRLTVTADHSAAYDARFIIRRNKHELPI